MRAQLSLIVPAVIAVLSAGGAACSSGTAPGGASSTSSSGSSSSSSSSGKSSSSSSSGSGVTSATIAVSDLSKTCGSPSDCMVVAAGVSCCTVCPSVAIAKSANATYNSRAATARAMIDCSGDIGCPAIACVTPTAACTGGMCVIGSGSSDAGH